MNKMIVMCLEEIPVNYTGVVFHGDGVVIYFHNGQVHRERGPAIQHKNGLKKYLQHGRLHREDGPAIIHTDGHVEYWINGEDLSREEFELFYQFDQHERRNSHSGVCAKDSDSTGQFNVVMNNG